MIHTVIINKGAGKLLDPSSAYWRQQCKAGPGIWVREEQWYSTKINFISHISISNLTNQHPQAGLPSECVRQGQRHLVTGEHNERRDSGAHNLLRSI